MIARGGPPLVFEDEGDLHVDLVLGDLAVLQADPLLLDPGGGDVTKVWVALFSP